MRRHEYEQFMKDSLFGLLSDCVYYCWQHREISESESAILTKLLNRLYELEMILDRKDPLCF